MSLVKRLQGDPITIILPWHSRRNVNAGRLVNDKQENKCFARSSVKAEAFDMRIESTRS
jgi:hypothetical protein